MKHLVVKERFLAYDDGKPFFYLGDTAWEMLHKLSREEIEYFIKERNRQGFTVLQTVALAEFEGVTTQNYYGRLPLKFSDNLPDPTIPDIDGDYSYWDHVDFAIKTAEQYGIFIGLLPTWGDKFNLGDWGKGPKIFNAQNAYIYGKWIAARYANFSNIIWILGGDRILEKEHRQIIDAMAKGIKEADSNHLITFHPPGNRDSSDYLLDAEYIDFHTSQTGHGIEQCYQTDVIMRKMAEVSKKPFLDSEPRYESHPACFDSSIGFFWNEAEVRQNAYWNVLSGACGHTYGNHNVWSMNRERDSYFTYTWKEAVCMPGAEQMRYIKELRLKRDYFSLRYAPELILDNYEGEGHMVAAKGNDYAYIYSPLGIQFTVDLGLFDKCRCVRAIWFNPRNGEENVFTVYPSFGKTTVVPPTRGKGNDWVLILEKIE